jgi:hypothetical protein
MKWGPGMQNRDWLGQSALHFRERLMHHSLLRAGKQTNEQNRTGSVPES